MNFGSKFNRVIQQADRLFLRGDKTDVVGELRYAEEQAEELRILCEALCKSLEKRLNTHLVTEEKKHRKVPENQVAETLKEALKEVSQTQPEDDNEKPLFKSTIEEIVAVEQLLGKEVLDHEDQVEVEVLLPLHKLLKEDFPSISKQKKALKQAGLDVDAAKAKVRNSHVSISQPNKMENYREELEEAESRLEQTRDSYACDLFSILGKQREVARLCNLYQEMKVDHLQKQLQRLNVVLPPIRKIFDESPCSPIYGVPLYEHLRITQQEIAVPIQLCVKRMIEVGMHEEGLLRMAGSSTKIKRLKGLFDAGLIALDASFDDYNRDYDMHVIAGAFKSYLRELPEPLLTHTKHDELIEAVRKTDHKEKLRHMWQVINALPMQNYNNLRYVIKFLAMLASYNSENKMTANNIAIVMAPNLIGTQRENDTEIAALGRNMTLGNDYRVVVEQLIEYADYFFKGELDFGVQPRRIEPLSSPKTAATTANGSQFARTGSHRRTGSADFNLAGTTPLAPSSFPESESPKQPHRIKKKPAPLPPQGKGVWVEDSGPFYPQSHSPEPVRSKTPPSYSSHSTNNNPMPSPAPRLHHTNSIKRPTAEPPKPPGSIAPPIKPPRPSPPAIVGETHGEIKDSKPPRPFPPPQKVPGSSAEPQIVPIGFENPEVKNPTDIEVISRAENCDTTKPDVAEKPPPVIGFVVDATSETLGNRNSELKKIVIGNHGTEPLKTQEDETSKPHGTGAFLTHDVEASKSQETEHFKLHGKETSKTHGTESSKTQETETTKVLVAEPPKTQGIETLKLHGTESSKTHGTETAKPHGTGTYGTEICTTQGSGTSGTQGSGTSGTKSSGTSGTQGSGTSGTKSSGTSGTQGSGTSGTKASGTSGTQGSGTSGTQGSGTSGTQGSGTSGTQGSGSSGTHGIEVCRTISVKDRVRETELSHADPSGDEISCSKVNLDTELRKGTGGSSDLEFRKSLEGVLKHQPQPHSRHLVKPSSGAAETTMVDSFQEKPPVQLPLFPVPALRGSKEGPGEKPEPAPRSDKPVVPEKPTTINRALLGSDSRFPVMDRPVVMGTKVSALSSSFIQGISRSSEKLVELNLAGQSGTEQAPCGEGPEAEHESVSVEKPAKPPKPGSVKILPELEASAAPVSVGDCDRRGSGSDSETKSVCPSLIPGTKPDSTHL